MTWQDEALKSLKDSGVPVTLSKKTDDALIVETVSSDGEPVTITATKGTAAPVADLLGYSDGKRYIVQAGAYKNRNYAAAYALSIKNHGFPAIVKKDGDLYRVQCGSFSVLNNAKLLVGKLKAAGFDAIIKEV